MDKTLILELRDFIRDLKPSQFDNNVGITGPVYTYDEYQDKDFSKITAGIAEWCALLSGDDSITDQDTDGTWFWVSEENYDYAFNAAEYLELYHDRVLRKLFDPKTTRNEVITILGDLLVYDTEEDAWANNDTIR